jgi:predicted HTH transcriptional regulator
MLDGFLIIVILVFGILIVRYLAVLRAHNHVHRDFHDIDDSDASGLAKVNKERHVAFKKRVMTAYELFKEKDIISNGDLENELGVSDATATRYLEELEQMGKIEQIGKTGRGVKYRSK